MYLNNGSFKSEVDPHQFNLREKKDFQKLAGLWLAGEMVNRIWIYGSKVAEGLSAFQRRSCIKSGSASHGELQEDAHVWMYSTLFNS